MNKCSICKDAPAKSNGYCKTCNSLISQPGWNVPRLKALYGVTGGKHIQVTSDKEVVSDVDYDSPEKNRIRTAIVKKAKKYAVRTSNIAFLDSPQKLLISEIRKQCLAFNIAHVPNDRESIRLTDEEKKKFVFYDRTELQNILVPKPKMNLSFIWADYCGEFKTYKDDIEKMFMYDVFHDHSALLVMTFCNRGGSGEEDSFPYWYSAIAKVQKYAVTNGYYTVVEGESEIYGQNGKHKSMYWLSFEVNKLCR